MLLHWPANVPGLIKQTASRWENGKHWISCLFPSFPPVIRCFTSFSRKYRDRAPIRAADGETFTKEYAFFYSNRGLLVTPCKTITDITALLLLLLLLLLSFLNIFLPKWKRVHSFSMSDCTLLVLQHGYICLMYLVWSFSLCRHIYMNTYLKETIQETSNLPHNLCMSIQCQ